MSRAWAGGSTRAWRTRRARVLSRDGYRCRVQLPGCTGAATQVHHVLGKGVSEHESDLVASCAPCNYAIGDPKPNDAAPRPTTKW